MKKALILILALTLILTSSCTRIITEIVKTAEQYTDGDLVHSFCRQYDKEGADILAKLRETAEADDNYILREADAKGKDYNLYLFTAQNNDENGVKPFFTYIYEYDTADTAREAYEQVTENPFKSEFYTPYNNDFRGVVFRLNNVVVAECIYPGHDDFFHTYLDEFGLEYPAPLHFAAETRIEKVESGLNGAVLFLFFRSKGFDVKTRYDEQSYAVYSDGGVVATIEIYPQDDVSEYSMEDYAEDLKDGTSEVTQGTVIIYSDDGMICIAVPEVAQMVMKEAVGSLNRD